MEMEGACSFVHGELRHTLMNPVMEKFSMNKWWKMGADGRTVQRDRETSDSPREQNMGMFKKGGQNLRCVKQV